MCFQRKVIEELEHGVGKWCIEASVSMKVGRYMFRNKNLSVPIVDDCRLTRRFYEMHIKKFGVKVQADENGKQAVDLFRSGTSFNLNIKDQDMPVMDGNQAVERYGGELSYRWCNFN
ncbi:hypothetical protein GOBAR_DD26502 [Gossypium barbadense]|nr:hypothetical protein GOBAR_DD26502 [Gossypium barbadense]